MVQLRYFLKGSWKGHLVIFLAALQVQLPYRFYRYSLQVPKFITFFADCILFPFFYIKKKLLKVPLPD